MQKKDLDDISLFDKELNLLEQFRDLEREIGRGMGYWTETWLTGSDETLDNMDIDDADIQELAAYMEDVRTQRGELFESDEGVRNPIDYELGAGEQGVEAQLVYQHPRGIVVSEIRGRIPKSGYRLEDELQDD